MMCASDDTGNALRNGGLDTTGCLMLILTVRLALPSCACLGAAGRFMLLG